MSYGSDQRIFSVTLDRFSGKKGITVKTNIYTLTDGKLKDALFEIEYSGADPYTLSKVREGSKITSCTG